MSVIPRSNLVPQISPPPTPTSEEDLGIPSAVIEHLLLKHLSAYPKSNLVELSARLCVVSTIVETSLAHFRARSWVEVYQPLNATSSYSNIRYGLTELGMAEAELAFRREAYIGPVPVSLEQYWDIVEQQNLRNQPIAREDVERALDDVYGAERLIPVLGPAINSGKGVIVVWTCRYR